MYHKQEPERIGLRPGLGFGAPPDFMICPEAHERACSCVVAVMTMLSVNSFKLLIICGSLRTCQELRLSTFILCTVIP